MPCENIWTAGFKLTGQHKVENWYMTIMKEQNFAFWFQSIQINPLLPRVTKK